MGKINKSGMKRAAILPLGVALLIGCAPTTGEIGMQNHEIAVAHEADSKALLDLSKQKWLWMADRKTALLETLFHDEAAFVHMGATMSKSQELAVIEGGQIHYKKAEIQNASVKIIGDAAILLNKIWLVAVVGGNEVTNPFVVTEVYVRQGEEWKLASMSFTRLLGE
ncbi:MAG: nuclear transport factor 2 family protein [Novosphingobium sp.]|nr:nuclear transport factor 2 family protein [Novosphingobium sp.]